MIFSIVIICYRAVLLFTSFVTSESNFNGIEYLLVENAKNVFATVIQLRNSRWGIGIWFLPCLFVGHIILFFISRAPQKLYLLSICICFTIGYLWAEIIHFPLPWGIDAACVAVFFMGLGISLKKKLSVIVNCHKKSFIILISLIVNIIFTFLNYKLLDRPVDMWSNVYGNAIFYLLAALSGILFALLVSSYLNWNVFVILGQRTIYYYGLHTIFIQVLAAIIVRFVNNSFLQSSVFGLFSSIFIVLFIVVILWPFYGLYMRLFNAWCKKFDRILDKENE